MPLENTDQATFYAMWARVPLYILTNGREIKVYRIQPFFADSLELNCSISDLVKHIPTLFQLLHPDSITHYCQSNKIKSEYFQSSDHADYLGDKLTQLQGQLINAVSLHVSRREQFHLTVSSHDHSLKLQKVPIESLTTINPSVIITGELGAGKTWLTRTIACAQILQNDHSPETPVPVIIEAKRWGKDFHSLTDAILQELQWFIPGLVNDIVLRNIKSGRYLILIDGLDEVTKDKDQIHSALLDIAKNSNSRVIATCRTHHYHEELHEHFTCCNIDPLEDEQIRKYLRETLKTNHDFTYYGMGPALRNLVQRPLFLRMTAQAILRSKKLIPPKNISSLYLEYSDMLLDHWEQAKGREDTQTADKETKKSILKEYASITFTDSPSDTLLNSLLQKHSSIWEPQQIRSELFRSGLLISSESGPDFGHRSLLEFFFAEYLCGKDDDSLRDLVVKYCCRDEYVEVFIFLAGLLSDRNRLNIVLDVLEEQDLPLYWKCLCARFRLDENTSDASFAGKPEKYLAQIRASYLHLVFTHFREFVPLLEPWCYYDYDSNDPDDVLIEGEMDLQTPSVSFGLSLQPVEAKKLPPVTATLSKMQTPTVSVSGSKQATPIISFSVRGRNFYNLLLSDLGIDSSREVAFSKIRSQLHEILEKRIYFVNETAPLQLEYLEKCFTKIRRSMFLIPETFRDISLHNGIDATLDLLAPYADKKRVQINPNYAIDASSIYSELLNIKNLEIDIPNNLLPEPDRQYEEIGSPRVYPWMFYTEDRISEYLRRLFDWYQEGYRHLAKQLFPTIAQQMYLYRIGPIRFHVRVYKSDPGRAGTMISWKPVSENENRSTLVTFELTDVHADAFNIDTAEQIRRDVYALGRDGKTIEYNSSGGLNRYFDSGKVVRRKVFKRLLKDLEELLGQK